MLLLCSSCVSNSNSNNTPAEESITEKEEYVIKIGVLSNQSAGFSNEGKRAVLGIKYAAEKKKTVTIDEQEYDLRLEVANYTQTQSSALKAANELIAKGADIVIASFCGQYDKAAARLKEANIPVIDYFGQSSKMLEENENIFSLCTSAVTKARFCAKYAHKTKKSEKAYILCDISSTNSKESAFYFKESFEAYSKSAKISYFERDCVDFSSYAKEIRNGKYDIIYAPIDLFYAQNLLSALNKGDCYADIISDTTWDTPQLLSYGDNGFYIFVPSLSTAKSNDSFDTGFSNWIESDEDLRFINGGTSHVSSAAVLGCNSYNIAALAAKRSKDLSYSSLLNALKKGKFSTVSGQISFDSSRMANGVRLEMKFTDYDTNTLVVL